MEEEESQLAHPLPPSSAHTDSTAASLDPSGGSLILLPSGLDRSLLSWNGKIAHVPISVAYKCYSDSKAIPEWMPIISTVKILEDKPNLARWSLKYKAFGQNIEYSGLARNMQALKPFLENLLAEGFERSATFAKSYSADTRK
ncbi:hypothetical protein MTR67_003935 [Solanum verrucosum]|uniref:Coenzyme Q-binding protein COQ10 START domain-containing protein n=1 Tax=Solanum verrucosum TaxID=315347 RepID=A0AAF0PV87_SOLVR|nr:hypothetical protein MTR67_003935 [Solanum verrucosum]